MKRFVLLGIMSILGLGLCSAQESVVVHGKVVSDESKKPVSSGSVNLVNKDSLNLIAFESIDVGGVFELHIPGELPLNSLLLSIESLGYEQFLVGLDTLDLTKVNHFFLTPAIYLLDEVMIEDMPSVRQSVDTIAFDPRAYMDSSERTLEDILKKLPGVDVSEEGKISIGNKEIRQILLDGDDLSGSDYRVISQNLPIELVKRLEFVSNYVENTLLAGFDVPEALVLNVQLHEEKARKPSLNFDLGLGTAQNQVAALNSLAFWKRFKFINILQHQTLGDKTLPPLAKPWEGLQDVASTHPLVHGEVDPPAYSQPSIGIPSGFIPIRFNSTQWGLSRIHFKPSGKVKTLVEVAAHRDRASRFMEVERTFFVGQRSFGIEESYELESLRKDFHFQVKNQIYTGKKSNLTTFSIFSWKGDRSGSELALESNDLDINFNNRNFRQDHKLAWVRRFDSQNIMIVDGGFSSLGFGQSLLMESAKERPFLLRDPVSRVEQDLNLQMIHMNGNVRWIRKLNENLSFHNAFRYSFQRESFSPTAYSKQVVNADIKVKYRLARSLMAFVNLQSGLMNLKMEETMSPRTSQKSAYPYFNARALVGSRKLKYNWSLSYSFRQILPNLDQVNRGLFWTTYRTLSLGDSVIRIGHSHNIQGRIVYNLDLTNYNRFSSFAHVRLMMGNIPYQNFFVLDSTLLIEQWGEGDSRVRQAHINTGMEQYFSQIKTAFKIRPSFRYSVYNNQLDDEARVLHSYNVNLNFSLRTVTSTPFDIMLGGQTSWNHIQVSGQLTRSGVSSFSNSNYSDLMIHLPWNMEFVFRNEWLRIANHGQSPQNFTFQEFELEIPAWEKRNFKADFQLLGKNLANVTFYGLNSVTDYYAVSNRIRLRPRTFMLRLNVAF